MSPPSIRAIVVLLIVAGSSPLAAQAATSDKASLKDAIQAREKEWSAAYLAGNGKAIAALYTKDAASVPASGEWDRGRDAIAKSNQAQLDSMKVTMRQDITEEVTPAGDYALEIGNYSYTGTGKADGKPRSGSGRYMVLWQKDADGVWRLHRDLGNEAKPSK